jgi:hypothetical protein
LMIVGGLGLIVSLFVLVMNRNHDGRTTVVQEAAPCKPLRRSSRTAHADASSNQPLTSGRIPSPARRSPTTRAQPSTSPSANACRISHSRARTQRWEQPTRQRTAPNERRARSKRRPVKGVHRDETQPFRS